MPGLIARISILILLAVLIGGGALAVGQEGSFTAVAVSGDYVYLGEAEGLTVLNCAGEGQPIPVGRITLADRIADIEIAGSILYLSAGHEFRVFDLADPAAPVARGEYDTTETLGRFAIGDGRAYVLTGQSPYFSEYFSYNLRILDINDPDMLSPLGTYDPYSAFPPDLPEYPLLINDVAVLGDRAFLTVRFNTQIVDVSNPAAPRFTGIRVMGGNQGYVAVSGGRLYLVFAHYFDMIEPSESFVVFDIGSEGLRQRGGHAHFTGYESQSHGVTCIAVEGTQVAYGTDRGVRLFDMSDPDSPLLAGEFSIPGYEIQDPGTIDIAMAGGKIYTVNASMGLKILEPGELAAPVARSTYDWPGEITRIGATFNQVFFQDMGPGDPVRVLNVDRIDSPTLVATMPHAHLFEAVDYDFANHVYYANDWLSLLTIEKRNLGYGLNINTEGSLSLGFNPRDMAVAENIDRMRDDETIYLVGGGDAQDQFQVIRRESGILAVAGNWSTTHTLMNVAVAGNRTYVSYNDHRSEPAAGLLVFDTSLPTSSTLPAACQFSTTVSTRSISGGGRVVCATLTNGKMRVFDVSDPAAPRLGGLYQGERPCRSVQVKGYQAWLACGDENGSAIELIDLSDPDQPQRVLSHELGHPATMMDLAIREGQAFVLSSWQDGEMNWVGKIDIVDIGLHELHEIRSYGSSAARAGWECYP